LFHLKKYIYMKWLFFAPLLFVFSLHSQSALSKRVEALEKEVFSQKRCEVKTVRMAFRGEVSEVNAPSETEAFCTPEVQIKFPLFKTKTIIVYPPVSKGGIVQAFKLKIGGRYEQNTFTTPVYIMFTGKKFTLYE
jgi:hypothetical protein